jgi:hypothetical protein
VKFAVIAVSLVGAIHRMPVAAPVVIAEGDWRRRCFILDAKKILLAKNKQRRSPI